MTELPVSSLLVCLFPVPQARLLGYLRAGEPRPRLLGNAQQQFPLVKIRRRWAFMATPRLTRW